MEDCLKIEIKADKSSDSTKATVHYSLYSRFKEEPIYIGQNDFNMYTTLGDIDWGAVIRQFNMIMSSYTELSSSLNVTFIGDVKAYIEIFNTPTEELFESYKKYQRIMGCYQINSQLEQLKYNFKLNGFIPSINGEDLDTVLPER